MQRGRAQGCPDGDDELRREVELFLSEGGTQGKRGEKGRISSGTTLGVKLGQAKALLRQLGRKKKKARRCLLSRKTKKKGKKKKKSTIGQSDKERPGNMSRAPPPPKHTPTQTPPPNEPGA